MNFKGHGPAMGWGVRTVVATSTTNTHAPTHLGNMQGILDNATAANAWGKCTCANVKPLV